MAIPRTFHDLIVIPKLHRCVVQQIHQLYYYIIKIHQEVDFRMGVEIIVTVAIYYATAMGDYGSLKHLTILDF